MKMLYVSKEMSLEARCILDGLNQTEDGPEKVFVIRASDPAAAQTVQAWIQAGRIHGYSDQVLRQAEDFLRAHNLYKAHFGVFPKTIPDTIREETHKASTPPPPPKPAIPSAPSTPQEIGSPDGGPQQQEAPRPKLKRGGPRKRGMLAKDMAPIKGIERGNGKHR